MIKRNELKEFNIKTKQDVEEFVKYLALDLRCSFHPDNSFSDMINLEAREHTFDQEAADYLDEVNAKCFDVAGDYYYGICYNAFDDEY